MLLVLFDIQTVSYKLTQGNIRSKCSILIEIREKCYGCLLTVMVMILSNKIAGAI